METYFSEKFNEQKALNAVLYVAHKLKRNDFHKIFKILYFSDRNHISDYGRSITGDIYIAMSDGPVPSKLYDIFKSVRGDGYFKGDKFLEYFQVVSWNLIKPIKMPDLKTLSKTDIDCLDASLNTYGNMSWDEVREKSHDYAWRNTVQNAPISIENLIIESGDEIDYAEYIKEQMLLAKSF